MKNDLISRQALIDAFKEEFYQMYSDDFNYMVNWIKNFPAAEPGVITMRVDIEKEKFEKMWGGNEDI